MSNLYSYSSFVLAFHDVMGQSELLQKWNDIDKLNAEDKETVEAFENTTQVIREVRDDFRNLIEAFGNTGIDFDELDLDPELKTELKEIDRFVIKHQSFSDTNIWFAKTHTKKMNLCAKQILYLLYGVAGAHFGLLARKIPCRGAISLGVGTTDLYEGADGVTSEIYGPVLETAYKIESQVADYCRVVLDDNLVDFLGSSVVDLSKVQKESLEHYAAVSGNLLLSWCSELITQDTDGAYILDFAGKFVSNQFKKVIRKTGGDPSAMFQQILVFAVDSQQEWATKRNFKLAGRYARLRGYLETSKKHWTE